MVSHLRVEVSKAFLLYDIADFLFEQLHQGEQRTQVQRRRPPHTVGNLLVRHRVTNKHGQEISLNIAVVLGRENDRHLGDGEQFDQLGIEVRLVAEYDVDILKKKKL